MILNCRMLSSPCESCTTLLPLSLLLCRLQSGWGGVASWAGHTPAVFYSRSQGALPTQDLCHLAQHNIHLCCGAPRGITRCTTNPGAGRASAAQPGCPEPCGAHGRCSCWAVPTGGKWGGSVLPTLWVCTSLLRQGWGVISSVLYCVLEILVCCPKAL